MNLFNIYHNIFKLQVEKLDQSLGKYLRAQPVAFQNSGQHESMAMKNIRKCPVCKQANLVQKTRPNGQGFYITCAGFPACRNTYWLPPSVTDVQVSDNVCSQVLYFVVILISILIY